MNGDDLTVQVRLPENKTDTIMNVHDVRCEGGVLILSSREYGLIEAYKSGHWISVSVATPRRDATALGPQANTYFEPMTNEEFERGYAEIMGNSKQPGA